MQRRAETYRKKGAVKIVFDYRNAPGNRYPHILSRPRAI